MLQREPNRRPATNASGVVAASCGTYMGKEITRNRSRRSVSHGTRERMDAAKKRKSRSTDTSPLPYADEARVGQRIAGYGKNSGERLQKVLSRAGIASRRQIESWVAQGRIAVDGECATIGQRIELHQIVHIDGRRLPGGATNPKRRILIYHKPEGRLCTRADPRGRPTVFSDLPKLRQGRWVSVGRLDFNSSGLLLFTNDGELAYRAMHPKYRLEREYAVRVLGNVKEAKLKRLTDGISLEDGIGGFETIRDAGGGGANHWYHVTLKEGRNREVRRLWDAVGVQVSRLIRVRYGPVTMPRRLRQGKSMDLEPEQTDMLFAFKVAKHVKSNAIVYVKDGTTVGIGAGQMSRVDSARIAAAKAEDAAKSAGLSAPRTQGSVVASDAFFPFADGLLAAVEAGASAVIQPGGSMRDDEVIAAADEAGLAMVFTGMRHFRH